MISVALNDNSKAMGVMMKFYVLGTSLSLSNPPPSFAKSEYKTEILELRSGILILSKTHHVALEESINFSASSV